MQMDSAKTATKQPINLGKTLILPPKALLLQVKTIVSCPQQSATGARKYEQQSLY
jgi:hypothetical protein